MSCDVGIVSFCCFDCLKRCLESLYRFDQGSFKQILVFENGPVDFPGSLLKEFPKVRFFKNHKNLGFAKACNQILERSSSDYVCFLNPDTELKAPFLKEAVGWLEENRQVAVLGPKIVDPDGTVQGSARGFPNIMTSFFGRTSVLTRLLPQNPISKKNIKVKPDASLPRRVDWVSGACMVVRKKAVDEVGPLDEGFFMYWEDCDWCTRFRLRGWKVMYHPALGPITHYAGSSSKRTRLKSLYWFHKSAVRLYCKYDKSPLRLGSALAVAGGVVRFFIYLPHTILSGR